MARNNPFYSFVEFLEFLLNAETREELDMLALFLLEEASSYTPADVFALLGFYRDRWILLPNKNQNENLEGIF